MTMYIRDYLNDVMGVMYYSDDDDVSTSSDETLEVLAEKSGHFKENIVVYNKTKADFDVIVRVFDTAMNVEARMQGIEKKYCHFKITHYDKSIDLRLEIICDDMGQFSLREIKAKVEESKC